MGEKGWARRAVVVRGVEPSGAADFEAVPGREDFGSDEEGARPRGRSAWYLPNPELQKKKLPTQKEQKKKIAACMRVPS